MKYFLSLLFILLGTSASQAAEESSLKKVAECVSALREDIKNDRAERKAEKNKASEEDAEPEEASLEEKIQESIKQSFTERSFKNRKDYLARVQHVKYAEQEVPKGYRSPTIWVTPKDDDAAESAPAEATPIQETRAKSAVNRVKNLFGSVTNYLKGSVLNQPLNSREVKELANDLIPENIYYLGWKVWRPKIVRQPIPHFNENYLKVNIDDEIDHEIKMAVSQLRIVWVSESEEHPHLTPRFYFRGPNPPEFEGIENTLLPRDTVIRPKITSLGEAKAWIKSNEESMKDYELPDNNFEDLNDRMDDYELSPIDFRAMLTQALYVHFIKIYTEQRYNYKRDLNKFTNEESMEETIYSFALQPLGLDTGLLLIIRDEELPLDDGNGEDN